MSSAVPLSALFQSRCFRKAHWPRVNRCRAEAVRKLLAFDIMISDEISLHRLDHQLTSDLRELAIVRCRTVCADFGREQAS